jgi:hypothetical protein
MALKLGNQMQDKILELQNEAVDRIAETIKYKDFVLGSPAKVHQDNLSLSLIKSKIPGGDDNRNQNQAPINEKLASRLIAALEKSNEASLIQTESRGVKVIDAEVVVEES